jgi:hypothetical protein
VLRGVQRASALSSDEQRELVARLRALSALARQSHDGKCDGKQQQVASAVDAIGSKLREHYCTAAQSLEPLHVADVLRAVVAGAGATSVTAGVSPAQLVNAVLSTVGTSSTSCTSTSKTSSAGSSALADVGAMLHALRQEHVARFVAAHEALNAQREQQAALHALVAEQQRVILSGGAGGVELVQLLARVLQVS